MAKVFKKANETIEQMIKRFKKKVNEEGIIIEYKKAHMTKKDRERFEKQLKRREKMKERKSG